MHLAMAPFRLKPGITEDDLRAASDRFDEAFARRQDGIVRRSVVRGTDGGYADIVLFRDAGAMAEVIEAEQSDPACAAFMSIMDPGDVVAFEVVKTYG